MEMTTKQKLEAAIVSNCNPRTLLAFLKYEQTNSEQKMRRQREAVDFRFTQGELRVLDDFIDLLNKVVS